MGKFKNNKNTPERPSFSLSAEKKKLFLSIALTSAVSSAIYFGAANGIGNLTVTDTTGMMIVSIMSLAVPVMFWIAFAGFLAAYLIYNRAFTRKDITTDMLPDNWSHEKKEEYIFDGKRRMEKSKWMVSVLIPLLVPIAIDFLLSFTAPLIQNLLGITT